MATACVFAFSYGRELPEYFSLFLKSCGRNSFVQWIFFTDRNTDEYDIPPNFRVIYSHLNDIENIARIKFQWDDLKIEQAYKLCDYKPAFGYLFSEYLDGFDFWGYCDIDVVFGDLKKFLTDDLLKKYDKIYSLGHFTLIRNTEECRTAFMRESEDSNSWRKVFAVPSAKSFDEKSGINEKLISMRKKVYTSAEFADRSIFHKRFRTVTKTEMKVVFKENTFNITQFPKNRRLQIASVEDGKTYMNYYSWGRMRKSEVAYIHFRYNLSLPTEEFFDHFLITEDSVIPIFQKINKAFIKKYNPFSSIAFEFREFKDVAKSRFGRNIFSIREFFYYRRKSLSKIKWLRKIVRKIRKSSMMEK